jgi:hypothetical protein
MGYVIAAEPTLRGELVQKIHTNPSAGNTEPAVAGRYATLFVGAVWAGMLGAALAFVWAYGRNVPLWPDEWEYVTLLTGQRPITVEWLWAQHMEHRVVLPKIIWISLLQLTGNDFRAGMYGNVLLLGTLALVLILAARRFRGRTSYADAFFPLMLLHWGHWDNLLWAWEIQFVSSTFLAGVLLGVIVQSGAALRWQGTCLAGACLVLLPVCGANGLALVPALALWLVYAGLLRWGRPTGTGGRWVALLAWAFAATAILIVALSFVGYSKPNAAPDHQGVWAAVKMAMRFFAISIGHGTGMGSWPYSGLGMVCFLVASTALLAVAWLKRPEERLRAAGLLCFLGCLACLALAIGWARHWIYPRYVTLAAPALCAVYFTAAVYGGRRLGLVVQGALFTLAVVALPFNVKDGREKGSARCATMDAFERAVRAGAPLHEVAARYYQDVYFHGGNSLRRVFALRLAVLQDAGMEPYRLLKRDPDAEEDLAEDYDPDYPRQVEHVRKEVCARLPPAAIVLVVSSGDNDLLELEGRQAWHFPQAADGSHMRHYPAVSDPVVTHLEELREKGAQYIVFPKTAWWWLEDYPGLKTHLDRHARRIYGDEDCIIYRLSPKR